MTELCISVRLMQRRTTIERLETDAGAGSYEKEGEVCCVKHPGCSVFECYWKRKMVMKKLIANIGFIPSVYNLKLEN